MDLGDTQSGDDCFVDKTKPTPEEIEKVQSFYRSKAYKDGVRLNLATDSLRSWYLCLQDVQSDAEVAGDVATVDEVLQEKRETTSLRNDLQLDDHDEVERVIREYSSKVRAHVKERHRQP